MLQVEMRSKQTPVYVFITLLDKDRFDWIKCSRIWTTQAISAWFQSKNIIQGYLDFYRDRRDLASDPFCYVSHILILWEASNMKNEGS